MLGFFRRKAAPAPKPAEPPPPPPEPEIEETPPPPEEPAALFPILPTVGEMGTFLHHLTHQKRSVRGILTNLARGLGSQRALEWAHSLPADLDPFAGLQELPVTLQPTTLTAFLLLVEAETGQPFPDGASPLALATVLEFFGQVPEAEVWRKLFGADLAQLQTQVDRGLLERLRNQREGRTALDILEDLGHDSGSARVLAWVQRLRPRVPSGHFRVNDEQQALARILEANQRPVNVHTLMALCLFVDLEAGNLTFDQLDALVEAADDIDSSMYAMVAAAAAFGLRLTGYALEEPVEDPAPMLAAVAGQSSGGLMVCYRKPGTSGRWWEPLQTAEDCRKSLVLGLEFTGLVLGRLHRIEDVPNEGLDYLLESGSRLMASFLEGEQQRLRPVDAETLRQNPERREAFSGQVVARLSPYEGGDGLVWSGESVTVPSLMDWPGSLLELDQASLLGWSDALTLEFLNLRRLSLALRQVMRLLHPPRVSLRQRPALARPVLDFLASPRAQSMLEPMVGQPTREGLMALIQRDQSVDFLLSTFLARGLEAGLDREWLSVLLLHSLCVSEEVQIPGALKQFDAARMRMLAYQKTADGLSHDDPRVRALSAQVLSSREQVPDSNTRMVLEYDLSALLSDPDPQVVRPAAQGLVRLCLMDQVPLPPLVELGAATPAAEMEEGEGSRLDPELLATYESDLSAWVDELRAQDELAPLSLTFTNPEGRMVAAKAAPLVTMLTAIGQACREDGTHEARRYFALSTHDELEGIGLAFLESWRELARQNHRSVGQLVHELKAVDLLRDHRLLLEDIPDSLARTLGGLPHFGGLGRPFTAHHFKPYDKFGVWWYEPKPPGPPLRRRNTLLDELVELARRVDAEKICVVRLVSAPGVALEGLETYEPTQTTQRRVDPRQVEVLLPHKSCFVPLVQFWERQLAELVDPTEWPAMTALLALYQGGERSLGWTSRRERVVSAPTRPSAPKLDATGLDRLAQSLVQKFGLPDQAVRVATVRGWLEKF